MDFMSHCRKFVRFKDGLVWWISSVVNLLQVKTCFKWWFFFYIDNTKDSFVRILLMKIIGYKVLFWVRNLLGLSKIVVCNRISLLRNS